ncbi:MAG: hypothetical protein KGI30_11425, partial [Planctomycetota bacterium]|nr:hypothetical protein [Planctomycetota bacterium]
MKQYKILGLVVCVLMFSGCASVMRAFVPDSPRPNEDQLQTAKELSENNVSTIAGLQSDKQGKIAGVARAAIKSVQSAQTSDQVEAASNIAANAFKAIERADGTQKTLGSLQGKTMEDVLRMSTVQYMAGIAAQSAANVHNQEVVYEGIKTGWQWTKTNIGGIIGLVTLLTGGGVAARAAKVAQSVAASAQDTADKRSDLLVNQAAATEQWKKEHPEYKSAWESLKSYLVNVHSQTPLNI